jgi:uncharacterized protein YprB with RNaseH-like and TPR domain
MYIVPNKKESMSKILVWDLETAGVNALQADLSAVVNFGYKWVGERKAHVLTIDQFPGWFSPKRGLNDKPLLEAALKIMEGADILVAHYGDRFDKPFFAGRCVINGLTPPPPAKQRDTWYIAYKTFKFSSNRLANLADILGVGERKYQKKHPGEWPGWWLRALAGDKQAIHDMAKYCAQDVQTLEQVYLRLQPFDIAHPRIINDRTKCETCGGDTQYRGTCVLKQHRYRRFACKECGRWGRELKAVN